MVRGDRTHTHTHIEAVGLTGDYATSKKCTLNALNGHCKPRSNEILAATVFKQLVQGDLGLPKYIEKCKDVTAACTVGAVYDKSLRNAILLGLRN